jgi:hypothetical protein
MHHTSPIYNTHTQKHSSLLTCHTCYTAHNTVQQLPHKRTPQLQSQTLSTAPLISTPLCPSHTIQLPFIIHTPHGTSIPLHTSCHHPNTHMLNDKFNHPPATQKLLHHLHTTDHLTPHMPYNNSPPVPTRNTTTIHTSSITQNI